MSRIPDYLKAVVAAINPFSGGNSRMARSLRARAQPRDRKGRWIRTGVGFKFDFNIGGKIFSTIARSVGASSREGFIQVYAPRGDKNVPEGFYEVPSGSGEVVKAILPGSATSAESNTSVTDKDVVDFDSTTRLDAPEGWTSNIGDDGSPRWVSQDNRLEIYVNPETGKTELIENGEKVSEHDEVAYAFAESDRRDVEGSLTKKSKEVVARLKSDLESVKMEKGKNSAEAEQAQEKVDSALFNDPDSEETLELVDSSAPDPGSLGEGVKISDEERADMQRSPITGQHMDENGEFTEERKALHDEIVRKALEGSSPVENPTQWMNGGGPGAGKSSLTEGDNKELTGYDENSVLLDPDEVKRELPEVKEALARIEAGEATEADLEWAGLSHEESSYIAKRIHLAALERHHNVIFDGTGDGGISSVRKKVELARANGYKRVEANYLFLDPNEGMRRAKERQARSHRKVPDIVIEKTYENISQIFPELAEAELFDTLRLFDNNKKRGEQAELIFEQVDGETEVLNPESYDRFREAKINRAPQEGDTEPSGPPAPPEEPPTAEPVADLPEPEPTPEVALTIPQRQRTATEVNGELYQLRDRYSKLDSDLNSVVDLDERKEYVSEMQDISEQIDSLEAEAVRLSARERGLDSGDGVSVESLNTAIASVDAQISRRESRGMDASDLLERKNNLIKSRDALEAGEEPDVGEVGQRANPGAAGAVPRGVAGAPSRSARVERRGDSLRDVSGNVVATRIDEPSNADAIRADGSRVVELFEVDQENSEFFRTSLQQAADASEYGSSVTVHDSDYYKQDGVRMFLTQDGLGGIVLNGDEIVSGFMHPEASDRGQGAVISMVSNMVDLGGRRLDAYDTVLPGFYAEAGFKPVARVRWNDDFAPDGWNYELYGRWNGGRPDIVFMTYDPERAGSTYDQSEGEYIDDYDQGAELQSSALSSLNDTDVEQASTQRSQAAQERRQRTQEANNALEQSDGLLLGDVPLNSSGAPDNQSLVLAPIGQVVERTNEDGTKVRFVKVSRDVWKSADNPNDLSRYRSHQIRGGKMEYVKATNSDAPSGDFDTSVFKSFIPTPYPFPKELSDEDLNTLREIYRRQVVNADNSESSLRAEATVDLIDNVIASREDTVPEDTDYSSETGVTAPAFPRRVNAPLIEENSPESGTSPEAYTPGQVDVPGASDDPQVIADTFREVDLVNTYQMALLTNSDIVRASYPPSGDEIFGAEVNLPIDAVRDALQLMGVDTNTLSNPQRTSKLTEEIQDAGISSPENAGDFVSTRLDEDREDVKELRNLYTSYEELRSALAYAISTNPDSESVENIRGRMTALRGRIRRLELTGLNLSGDRPEAVALGDFRWDENTPDIYRPELVMDALKQKYPNAIETPDGELIVGSSVVTAGDGKRYVYEAIITKTDDNLFYTYIRETNFAESDPAKRFRSIRFGEMRHSARAVNAQAIKALAKIDNQARGSSIHSWFNDRRRRREGREPRFEVPDAQGFPHHVPDRVFTRDTIRRIQEAVNEDDITEEMIGALYNYIRNFGNDTAVMSTLYETFGLDTPTLNRFVDAVNQNIYERDGLDRFTLWESSNGTPLAEGDVVTYVGDSNQRGFERLAGRQGVVKIRSLEHTVEGYTYTDYVYIELLDDSGRPDAGENTVLVSSHNLRLDRTSGNTDGSERSGAGAISMPLPVLTTRAGNRYAGRGALGNVAPYVTEYDRNTLANPTVDIDGVQYPVQSSRQSLIGPDLANLVLRPGEVRTGDFVMQFDTTSGSRRLVEVVGVESLDGGRVKLTLVEPINLTSAKVSQLEQGPNDRMLDVYRYDSSYEADPERITDSHLGRLAEASRGADMDRMYEEARAEHDVMIEMFRYMGDPDLSPFTMEEYNNVLRELLSRQTNEPRGPISLPEARTVMEQIRNRALPNQDAREGLESVKNAAVSRGNELGVDVGTETPPSGEIPPATEKPEETPAGLLRRGPYGPEDGVVPGVDRNKMLELLNMPRGASKSRAFRRIFLQSIGDRVYGTKFTISEISVTSTNQGVQWTSKITDPETGQIAGKVVRSYILKANGVIDVHHDYVWFSRSEDTGTGFASEFYQVSDNFYQSTGIDTNTIQTARDGSYAWAAANFTWSGVAGISNIRARLKSKASDIESEDLETAQKLRDLATRLESPDTNSEDYPDPVDIALLRYPDDEARREQYLLTNGSMRGYSTLGREILQSTGWYGIRYFNPELDPRPENRRNKKSVKQLEKEEKAKKESESAQGAGSDWPTGQQTTSTAPIENAKTGDAVVFSEGNGSQIVYIKQEDGSWLRGGFGGTEYPREMSQGVLISDIDNALEFGTTPVRVYNTDAERKHIADYQNGTLTFNNPTREITERALKEGDIITMDTLYQGQLLGGGQKTFGRTDFTLTTSASSVASRGVYDEYNISGTIRNSDDESVGEFSRAIRLREDGTLEVYHSLLRITDDRYKRSGFGGDFTKQSDELYAQMGVDSVSLHAAWDGSYFWATQGYEWDLQYSGGDKYDILSGVPGNLQLALEQAKGDGRTEDVAKLQDIIDRMAGLEIDDPNFPSPKEITMLRSQDPRLNDDGQGGDKAWMQSIMYNTLWHGRKKLK